jgi:hypothetical protein
MVGCGTKGDWQCGQRRVTRSEELDVVSYSKNMECTTSMELSSLVPLAPCLVPAQGTYPVGLQRDGAWRGSKVTPRPRSAG